MKLFIAVIIAATVIGGFVGAELMNSTFSLTGAVVGGVGTAAIVLALGAFFDAQDRKEKEKALPPEMRAVFDRILGNSSSARQQNSKPAPRKQTQHTVPLIRQDSGNPQELYLATASGLITVQLLPKYPSPKKAFGAIMTNKRASGYVFGFHDSLLQHQGLRDQNNQSQAVELMESSYKELFGQQAGYVLFSSALNSQEDLEFSEGRINGGEEVFEFLEKQVPPLGLGRILILGMKS